ncbi:MAG: hypothetical protein KTR31_02730 [Myxococcales bacterium]|nr:hypothetical protein [Myxococcales bacterium]
MNSPRARQAAGLVLVLILAVIAAFFLIPRPDVQVDTPEPVAVAPPIVPAPAGAASSGGRPGGEAELVIIESDEPDIPQTEKCTTIAGWAQAGTPHYTLLDNIRDQAMLFTEEDLACLTAARKVPPIVLRFAEMYQDKNQKRPE